MALDRMMQWRTRVYGYPSLTPREYEAVTREMAIRVRRRGLSDERVLLFDDRLTAAWLRCDAAHMQAARRAMRDAIDEIARNEWGIQAEVAAEMGISKQSVSSLLKRASMVMLYLIECVDQAAYGWRQDEDGIWWLSVPIAPIEPMTRRKIRAGD
jgi:hypothetical protein